MGTEARADGGLDVTLNCPRRADPGRVVCELSLKSGPQGVITWVDALVVAAPPFVQPLRSRVTTAVPLEQTGSIKLPVAFVARELGSAEVSVRGRAVLCARDAERSARRCEAAQREVSATLTVAP